MSTEKTKPQDAEVEDAEVEPQTKTNLLTFKELKAKKGVRGSRMTLWRRMYQDNPPSFPLSISERGRIYWREDEIDAHLAKLANMERGRGYRPGKKTGA